MARIRYLAVVSEDPASLAQFYIEEVGMRELGRSPEGDVSLTEGYFNLTLFRQRAGLMELRRGIGLHHMGMAVDSIDEVLERYRALVPGGIAVREPGGVHYGEVRIFDPECNPISLSETAFGVEGEDRGYPRIGHVAIHMLQPQRTADFLTALFGLRELRTTEERRSQGRFNCFMGDGCTNLALHPYYRTRDEEGYALYNRIGHDGNEESPEERRFGIHHFGFLMRDAAQKAAQLSQGKAPVADRPEVRPYAEYRVVDPEGNGFDLTQNKGWEVDVDKWERVA
ncbi:MAG TPA: VOC family protein [Alphaproteobacteria bacterium]|jgi:catechol 2,3-dioxygenase-like lactoylglutathione lyase family enzyme